MKAYKSFGSHFYIVYDGSKPIHMRPVIAFAKRLPEDAVELPEDEAAFVLLGLVDAATRLGGESLAIHYLMEAYMAKQKGFLCLNLAGEVAVIAHIFAFETEAQKNVKEDGPFKDMTIILDEAQFNALTVEQRCQLARPLLNASEAAGTPDGQGLADIAFKICQRFKNPKPAASDKTPAAGKEKKVKPAAEPRAKGVKTLIFEHFTANKDTAHMTIEEIMAKVDGTKASVTTAISDLRSPKYAGKQGTMNLLRVNGKYCVEGSALEAGEKKAQAEAADASAKVKAAAKVKAEADKKAKAESKAALVADKKAAPVAGATA